MHESGRNDAVMMSLPLLLLSSPAISIFSSSKPIFLCIPLVAISCYHVSNNSIWFFSLSLLPFFCFLFYFILAKLLQLTDSLHLPLVRTSSLSPLCFCSGAAETRTTFIAYEWVLLRSRSFPVVRFFPLATKFSLVVCVCECCVVCTYFNCGTSSTFSMFYYF